MRISRLASLVFASAALALLGLSERSAQAQSQLADADCGRYAGPVCEMSDDGLGLKYYKK